MKNETSKLDIPGFGMRTIIFLITACVFLTAPIVSGVDIDREFHFAEELVGLGFPDLAREVADRVVRQHPQEADRAQLIEFRSHVARGDLQVAEDILKNFPADDPRAYRARLSLADAYFMRRQFEESDAIYKQFFENVAGQARTDDNLRRFYRDTAYRYAQMNIQRDNIEGALAAYENVLRSDPDKDLMVSLQSEMADLYVRLARRRSGAERRRNLERARELCNKVFWEGPGLWFGNCVVTLAYSYVVEGDEDRARRTLTEYWDMLTRIENEMVRQGMPLARSPRAGARFLRGELFAKLGDNARDEEIALPHYRSAATEFANVFIRYGTSKWAVDAWDNLEKIQEKVNERFGREMQIDMSRMADQAAQAMRQAANRSYQQGDYERALREYLRVVNSFPDHGDVQQDLIFIANSIGLLEDDLYARMLIAHLSERYQRDNVGALPLLALGRHYFNRDDEEMYLAAYQAYIDNFPDHDRVPAVLHTLAAARRRAGDMERSLEFLRRIIEDYPGSAQYLQATERLAWDSYEAGDYELAADAFKRFVEETPPGPGRARGQFSLADSLMRDERYAEAIAAFNELVQWVSPEDNPYSRTTEDVIRNRNMLERAELNIGLSLMRVEEPEGQEGVFRARALEYFEQFMEKHPESDNLPRAYAAKGRTLLELDRSDEAMRVFEQLAERYPGSDEGRSALFQLIRASVQIGRLDVALQALQQMMEEPDTYGPDQLVRVGQWFLDAEEYEAAILPFEKVIERDPADRQVVERSLYGLGQAYLNVEQYEGAASALSRLMERYPSTAFFYDARFLLARAYRELGRTSDAVEALTDVFTYADGKLRHKADFELGLIRLSAGETNRALGSFLRVGGSADQRDPELRPFIRESLYQCVVLYAELGQFRDVREFADIYLGEFPDSDRAAEVRRHRSDATLRIGS